MTTGSPPIAITWCCSRTGRTRIRTRFRAAAKQSDYYNREPRTAEDFLRDARTLGLSATLAERRAWGAMRMNPTDIADVGGATYTYLMNGAPPAGNWTGLFWPGERVRLRFINGSAMSYFDVRIPGLRMTVVAADGQPVHPVTVDEFRIALAETSTSSSSHAVRMPTRSSRRPWIAAAMRAARSL